MESVMAAFSRTKLFNAFTNDPFPQNRRVKGISSLPKMYGKDKVAEMLCNPDENEMPLRQVANVLEYTAYPFKKIRTTYQALLTYKNYVYPEYTTEDDAEKPELMREWRLADKLCKTFAIRDIAHKITGQCIRDGKVFYMPRYSVDKSHNKVNYAFLQQLPQDYIKIVGFNNVSKYTVAFNLMYFMKMGTDPAQFGDLFDPYIEQFTEAVKPMPDRKRYTINLEKARRNAEVYKQDGVWFYWVTLPIDKVFVFEADDVIDNVLSPLAGLIISMAQLAQYEQVQLQIVQNPLIAFLGGEIPYVDNKNTSDEDSFKMSPTTRNLFEAYWYQMMAANNTSGIGIYTAPFANMKLFQLAESPSASEISGNGYAYAIAKTGLAAILPATTDNRAGVAAISFLIEGEFAKPIYNSFMRMMNYILANIGFKNSFRFEMFGSLATDREELEKMQKSMELGILPDVFRYNALMDRSVLDDIAMSNVIKATGVLDLRIPLKTSYSARDINGEVGRPPVKGEAPGSDGNEGDKDSDITEGGEAER